MRAEALLLAALVACGRGPAPAQRTWPAGTVLALDERPILASEVEEAADCVALLEPHDSLDQLRRVALTNLVLPRCAAQAIDPQARKEAQARAEELQRALAANTAPQDLHPRACKGRVLQIGMELWKAALTLEPGQWTGVVETAGCFQIAHLLEKNAGLDPSLIELSLEIFDFPYLPAELARDRIQAQLDRSRLVYVDESWRAFVPVAWQHKLKGGSP